MVSACIRTRVTSKGVPMQTAMAPPIIPAADFSAKLIGAPERERIRKRNRARELRWRNQREREIKLKEQKKILAAIPVLKKI